MIRCKLMTRSVCSGDVRRENRFARVPSRPSPRPIRRPGDHPSRPAIINPDDLKDLDDLDNDCEDGWAGKHAKQIKRRNAGNIMHAFTAVT